MAVRRYATPTQFRGPWLNLILLALLVKAVLIALTLLLYGASPDPLTALGRSWDQWDAEHYLYLATHGYVGSGDPRNLIAFFPLYPALIAAVAAIGLPARLAALLISNVAGVVAAILLYEVALADRKPAEAWRAAAFFTIFPTAYFLLVGYSEALFCALAFGAVLAARRQHWMLCGMLGGLAAAARLTGLALLPFLLIELWPKRFRFKPIPPLTILLGFLVYLATNQLVLGSPLAFIEVQREHWSHSLSAPWVGFADAIRSLFTRVAWEKLTVGVGEIAGGLAAYTTATLSWLRLRPADAAYATVLTVMVTFLPFWLSIPRYLLSMYPLFLLVGRIESRSVYRTMVTLSAIALIVFALAFGRGYWAF
jgi:Gpi18-like mannosyltransferase